MWMDPCQPNPLLVVDRNRLTRELLAGCLLTHIAGYSVHAVDPGDGGAIARCRRLLPHTAVFRMWREDAAGSRLLELLHGEFPALRILAIHDEAGTMAPLPKGVRGVPVHAPLDHLIRAIRSKPVAPCFTIGRRRRSPGGATPFDQLSLREQEVVAAMGRGESVSQIALRLGVSPKTVFTYRSRISAKLQLKGANALLRFALAHAAPAPRR